MNNDQFKLIFSPQLAKYLLLKGFSIVDLKQKKENSKETIFVFKNSDALLFEVTNWISNK